MNARRHSPAGPSAALACALLSFAVVPLTRAQVASPGPTTTTTSPARAGTWLRVTADGARVYSRPDANSLAVTEVPRDGVLRSVALDEYGWYGVQPPADVFSYVSAEFVQRDGPHRGVVRVSSSSLRVRVGSLLREVDPLHAEVQARLERGDVVHIIGEQGNWLKIEPPEGVVFYVRQGDVEPISEEVARRLQPPAFQALTMRPATPPAARVTPPKSAPPPKPATPPDLSGPWGQRLLLAETAIEAEHAKEATKQSWAEHLARLRPIAEQREEPQVARLAQAWIAQVERRVAELDAIREADEVLRGSARDSARRDRELERIRQSRQPASTSPAFAARGQLMRSTAAGSQPGARVFRLQDPLTRALEAYVEILPGTKIDAEKWIGRYIGVRGQRRRDAKLGADVIRADELVSLDLPDKAPAAPGR